MSETLKAKKFDRGKAKPGDIFFSSINQCKSI
ncbi:hypothetical protein EPIR_3196 [Erwinia piriflorinigrans CFBP 5888]|uniref:Uncharacterized protein n=1 Tax=Erwinia piriflorinigrans CFBP 5888 TaxID=1161919 RepID=V5ZC89_9GAMM|nr:hypothetical protein EPIR_3196 [Erwinia piriflorinigrans CFBP 5888]